MLRSPILYGHSLFDAAVNGNNSPNNSGLTIVGFLYKVGWQQNKYGYASAVGIVLLLVTLAINLVQLKATGFFEKE